MANEASFFRGRRALVTGGSSGIGRALALGLVARGAHVAILARGAERLALVREELAAAATRGVRIHSVAADVADEAAAGRAVSECAAALGGLDLLVNDAGLALARRAAETSLGDYRRMLDVDFLGAVHVTRAALPELLAASPAAVVNVASLAALLPITGYAAYAPAKAALAAWSEVLRQELAPRIAVTTVYPPDTDTPQLAEENREKPPETRALAGGAGLLSAEAVAAAILRGVARGRAEVIPGASARALATLARAFPGIVRRVIARELRRARREESRA